VAAGHTFWGRAAFRFKHAAVEGTRGAEIVTSGRGVEAAKREKLAFLYG
jgi:hypothetical protein